MNNRSISKKKRERGIALAYVLAFLALMTLATTYLASTQRGVAQSLANQENKVALLEQATLIRGRIIGCVVSFPGGDNGTGVRVQYPAEPASSLVRDLTCPGQPGSNNLWSGTGGLTLPSPPRIFTDWSYQNDGTGLVISIDAASPGDPATLGVMDSIAQRLGPSASRAGNTLTIILMN